MRHLEHARGLANGLRSSRSHFGRIKAISTDLGGVDQHHRADPNSDSSRLLRVDPSLSSVRLSGGRGRDEDANSLVGADILFVDAYSSGVAGDMLSAALLHTGIVPLDVIERGLQSLMKSFHYGDSDTLASSWMMNDEEETTSFDAWFVEVTKSEKSGIVAPRFHVIEHELLRLKQKENDNTQEGNCNDFAAGKTISLQSYLRRHRNRNFKDIQAMLRYSLEDGGLSNGAYDIALRAFRFLAEAEAKVHDMDIDCVHFHEVGCVDSIVDIVTVSIAVDYLQPSEVIVSPLPMGRGIIRGAAHGPLPNPAPATVEILCASQIPTYDAGVDVELVTPTGACLLAAIASESSRWPSMKPMAVAYGCGTKTLADRANILRVVVASKHSVTGSGSSLANSTRLQEHSDHHQGHHHHHHHHHHQEDHAHSHNH